MSLEHRKATITLPKGLLKRLNKTVPNRKRSLFIAEAIEEQLDLIEQGSALEEAAGSWSLENHPTLQDDASTDQWLKDTRHWG